MSRVDVEAYNRSGYRCQEDSGSAGLALYVHWPFCISKCPYCDFNSHVRETVDQEQWRSALLKDLVHEADASPRGRLGSIFFGGGTPSLMPPETVAAMIEAAERHWGFAPDIEITLEANPSSVEAARFAGLAAAGVNRVSLGLQSLDDEALRFLGRAHGVAEGLAALETAQRTFGRVSFDLIYALPGQGEAAWAAELRRALSFGTEHLSLYQLTIEPGTRFAALAAKGELAQADPDHAATLYELTQAMTEAAGLPPTKSPTTPARARRAATISLTGAISPISASAPARTAGAAAASRSATKSPKTGSPPLLETATASPRKRRSHPPIRAWKLCSWACGSARASISDLSHRWPGSAWTSWSISAPCGASRSRVCWIRTETGFASPLPGCFSSTPSCRSSFAASARSPSARARR
jgi:hypothetical protein